MHIAFARPTYRSRDQVPAELVDAEREILEKLPRACESKPEPTCARRSSTGCSTSASTRESVLEEQTWIHDTGLTVSKALEQGGLELIEYAWLSVG